MDRKIRLFLSHASEDKDAFVRPLAEALRKDFDVWYDEHSLSLGDSLRSKIDQGLRECDYGVVVFSPSFFQKKWTVDEVNALYSLETNSRKILLPLWFNITLADMQKNASLFAERFAATVTGVVDIPLVVEKIKSAVGGSEQTRGVMVSKAVHALNSIDMLYARKELNERMFRTEEGVNLFKAACQKVTDTLAKQLEGNKRLTLIPGGIGAVVRSVGSVTMELSLENLDFGNSLTHVCYQAAFSKQERLGRGGMVSFNKRQFRPLFVSETEVTFTERLDSRGDGMRPQELVELLIVTHCDHLEKYGR